MPGRLEPFVDNYLYHVFNKTINSQIVFTRAYCETFLSTAKYYRSSKATVSLSHLKKLDATLQKSIFEITTFKKFFRVEILAYCLMPTHYHFLLKQKQNKGIQKFMTDLANSFTKFYNIKNEREGPLFIPRFKSVRITSEDQLKHVCRYIHLNPYSGGIITDLKQLEDYRWSSYREYIGKGLDGLSNPQMILELFGNDRSRYKKFVLDQADYQRSLEYIKHREKWFN